MSSLAVFVLRNLPPNAPHLPGALQDIVDWLGGFSEDELFEWVCLKIAKAGGMDIWLARTLIDDLVEHCNATDVVRFSFAPAIIPCFFHARVASTYSRKINGKYSIRYAGVGEDRQLVAFAALFLKLPLHVEVGPPWKPDALLEDDEPNSDEPDLEISFPPAGFRRDQGFGLEESLKEIQLPRIIDRGKLDLESAMLQYLATKRSTAFVFVSDKPVSSTSQAYLLTRQNLLDVRRIRRVTEIASPITNDGATGAAGAKHLIELGQTDGPNEKITVTRAERLDQICGQGVSWREFRGWVQDVTIEAIQRSMPRRFGAPDEQSQMVLEITLR